MKDKYPQPYIEAQLLKTSPNPPAFSGRTVQITYDEATDALVDFINVEPISTASS